jgi:hypothetical protein
MEPNGSQHMPRCQQAGPPTLSQDLFEQGTLQHLKQDGASPADVANVRWADLCRVFRADA